jgi:hypothetical protein
MAKNLGREYATMSEDERRQFALQEEEGSRELPAELNFEEPRDEDHMGQEYPSHREETADPEHRDGLSAQLDDEQHRRAVREQDSRPTRSDDSEGTETRIDDV